MFNPRTGVKSDSFPNGNQSGYSRKKYVLHRSPPSNYDTVPPATGTVTTLYTCHPPRSAAHFVHGPLFRRSEDAPTRRPNAYTLDDNIVRPRVLVKSVLVYRLSGTESAVETTAAAGLNSRSISVKVNRRSWCS